MGRDPTNAIDLANFAGDNDLDLVAANYRKPLKAYLNNGKGVFSLAFASMEEPQANAVAAADVDGDGDADLLVGGVQSKLVYKNDGKANFSLAQTLEGEALTQALKAADLDQDGDVDFVSGNNGDPNGIFLNDGTGKFTRAAAFGPEGLNTVGMAIKDFDQDGDLDLVAANFRQPNRLYLNDGKGNFSLGWESPEAVEDTEDLAAADFDADGYVDFVAAVYGGKAKAYRNALGGAPPAPPAEPQPEAPAPTPPPEEQPPAEETPTVEAPPAEETPTSEIAPAVEEELGPEPPESKVHVKDRAGKRVKMERKFFDDQGKEVEEGKVKPGKYRMKMDLQGEALIQEMEFEDLEVGAQPLDLTFDRPEKSLRPRGKGKDLLNTFSLDFSKMKFTNGKLHGTAPGNELWKCKEWDAANGNCLGEWVKIWESTKFYDRYEIDLSPEDPGFGFSSTVDVNGLLVATYGTAAAPVFTVYDANASGFRPIPPAAGLTNSGSEEIMWVDVEPNHTNGKFYLTTLDKGFDVETAVFDPYTKTGGSHGTWSGASATTNWVLTTDSTMWHKRAFDSAVETKSGNLLVVYNSGAAGSVDYNEFDWQSNTWTGGTLSVSSTNIEWARLESNPLTDEMLLVAQTAGVGTRADLFGIPWSGTAFGAVQTLNSHLEDQATQSFDISYEGTTSDALVVYAVDGNAFAQFNIWFDGNNTWAKSDENGIRGGVSNQQSPIWRDIDLASMPDNRQIMIVLDEPPNFDVDYVVRSDGAWGVAPADLNAAISTTIPSYRNNTSAPNMANPGTWLLFTHDYNSSTRMKPLWRQCTTPARCKAGTWSGQINSFTKDVNAISVWTKAIPSPGNDRTIVLWSGTADHAVGELRCTSAIQCTAQNVGQWISTDSNSNQESSDFRFNPYILDINPKSAVEVLDVNIVYPVGGEGHLVADGNIWVEFAVLAQSAVNDLNADLYYSLTALDFNNVLHLDYNLLRLALLPSVDQNCSSATFNGTSPVLCHVEWDPTGVSDGNYFIDVNVYEAYGVERRYALDSTPRDANTADSGMLSAWNFDDTDLNRVVFRDINAANTVRIGSGYPQFWPPLRKRQASPVNGFALDFNGGAGQSPMVIVPDLVTAMMTTGDFSWGAWVRSPEQPSAVVSTALAKGKITIDHHNPYTLGVEDNGIGGADDVFISLGSNPSVYNSLSTATLSVIFPNKWYHVLGTISGTTMNLYVNGKLYGTRTYNGTRIPATGAGADTNNLVIGAARNDNDANQSFLGMIDSVTLYNRALTLIEAQRLSGAVEIYNTAPVPPPPDNTDLPDVNLLLPEPAAHFLKADGNILVKFTVRDLSRWGDELFADLYASTAPADYNTTGQFGNDVNLAQIARNPTVDANCSAPVSYDTNSTAFFDQNVLCYYDWNPASLADQNYFIDVNVFDKVKNVGQDSSPQDWTGNETGLINAWNFNEGTLKIAHDANSVSAKDGNLLGGPRWDLNVGASHVVESYDLNFNGSTAYVDIGPSPIIGSLVNNFTIGAWVKPMDLTALVRHSIIDTSQFVTANNGFWFGTSGPEPRFATRAVLDYDATTITISTNKWYHLVATMDSSNDVTYFVDGVPREVVTYSLPSLANTDDNIFIGANDDGTVPVPRDPWQGIIDSVFLWNHAMSKKEIQRAAGSVLVNTTNTAPTVTYVSPTTAGQTCTSDYNITWSTDDADLDDVNFSLYYDTVSGGTTNLIIGNQSQAQMNCEPVDTNCLYTWACNPTDGDYYLTVKADDLRNPTTTSSTQTIHAGVLNSPDVNILWPEGGGHYLKGDGNILVKFTIRDATAGEVLFADFYASLFPADFNTTNQFGNDVNLAQLARFPTNDANCSATTSYTTNSTTFFDQNVLCYYDWNPASLADQNYFIDANVFDKLKNAAQDSTPRQPDGTETGLISAWNMNEGRALLAADANTLHSPADLLAFSGGPYWDLNVPFSPAVEGFDVNLGKSGDAITNAQDSPFHDNRGRMSMSIWLRPSALAANQWLLTKWDETTSADNSWGMRVASGASNVQMYLAASAADTGTYFTSNTNGLVNDKWQQLTAVFDYNGGVGDANRIRLFNNGNPMGGSITGTFPYVLLNSAQHVKIGKNDGTVDYNGFVDTATLWDAPLKKKAVKQWSGAVLVNTTNTAPTVLSVFPQASGESCNDPGPYNIGWETDDADLDDVNFSLYYSTTPGARTNLIVGSQSQAIMACEPPDSNCLYSWACSVATGDYYIDVVADDLRTFIIGSSAFTLQIIPEYDALSLLAAVALAGLAFARMRKHALA